MILTASLIVPLAAMPQLSELELLELMDFRSDEDAARWRPIHDGVMGGLSTGRATRTDDGVRFTGEVSLENNGGFASFRAGAELPDLSDHDGLRLRVRGDGQVYKLSLRTDGAWDGVSWQTTFPTLAGEWTDVDLAFDDLTPTWRGRLVTGAEAFDPRSVRQVGILIADGQEGPFEFEIASVGAWSAQPSEGPDDRNRFGVLQRTSILAEAIDEGADAEDLISELRWTERVLVIASPDGLDKSTSRQLARFTAELDEMADRELRIVLLLGSRYGRLAGRTLGPSQTAALREAWDLPTHTWQAALIGKDGGVKQTWDAPMETADVFDAIDAMPMRRLERAY